VRLWLDRSKCEDQPDDTSHGPRQHPQHEPSTDEDQDDSLDDDPADRHDLSKEGAARTLVRPKRGRRKSQPPSCDHNQPDSVVPPQHARGRVTQVVLELVQEPERPVDMPRWRVCKMTRHRAGNLGQFALFDKALPQLGWGNLPCDRATGTLPTALCPCRRSSSAMPSAACA